MAKRRILTEKKETPKEKKTVSEARKWLEKIDKAKKVRQTWKDNFKVAKAYEYLEGRVKPDGVSDDDWILINMIFSVLRSILPTYYQTDPYFYIKLKRSFRPNPLLIAAYEAKAQARQSFLNYLKPELNLKQKVRLGIFDAFFQYGVIKTHATADLIENPEKGEPIKDEDGNPMMDPKTNEPITQPELLPANQAYKVTRVHPDDFLVDEDAGPLEEDISWCAQRIKRPIEDVREDKRYNQAAREMVQPTEISDADEKAKEYRQKGKAIADKQDPEAAFVVTWEIYDFKKTQWLTVAEGCDEFLIEPDATPKGMGKHPYSFLRFFLRDASWYPIPPATQWLDQQREYCDARSKLMVHRKRFNRKYEADATAFDDPATELSKLETGGDGTVLQTHGTQGASAIKPIADAPLDQNNILEINLIRKDFEDLALGPNQRGSSQGVDSATEAGILEKRSLIQEGDDISLIVDFVTDMARKLDQEVQVHMTEDQAIKVEGPDGQAAWQLIRQSDYDEVEGEYEYSVNVGQMRPQLPEIERAQWNAFLTTVISAPQLLMSRRLLMKTAEMFSIQDESMVDELQQIGKQMLSGQMPMPGRQGSAPGSPAMPQASMGAGFGVNNVRGGQQ